MKVCLHSSQVVQNCFQFDEFFDKKFHFLIIIQNLLGHLVYNGHYSKKSILTKPQHFHEFFTKNFFLVNSKLLTAKKSKPTTFSRVFHPEKSTIFSGNQSWILGQKMKISNSVLLLEFLGLKQEGKSALRHSEWGFFKGLNPQSWHSRN